MGELRFNLITQDWVIVSTERAKRPFEFRKPASAEVPLPAHDPHCPFCPGNEGDCADERERFGDAKAWRVRALFNKYPALDPEAERIRGGHGVYAHMGGFGIHEVIVEHPRHNTAIALMSDEEVADILRMYRSRYLAAHAVKGIEAITLFKNHGGHAGASQKHPHSQLIATPIVPRHTRDRLNTAIQFFDVTGHCVFCDALRQELKEATRIILETASFAAFVPYAAAAPFLTWIVPKRHTASFAETTDAELVDLAALLRSILGRLYRGLGNPDFNYIIRSIPVRENGEEYFHWYLSIIPRITDAAGFELGSGMFINTSLPEECAAFLRGVV